VLIRELVAEQRIQTKQENDSKMGLREERQIVGAGVAEESGSIPE